ncbi:CCA tRNA nucleotidyltransferase [bacterium]|nr:CCA tRNA nucleotidyltransferase [candidate division CSSED10-310 bacterium]
MRLRSAGFRTLFAGGCVRDLLMGYQPGDYDIATAAHPEEVRTLFRKTLPMGIRFGVVIVSWKGYQFEVASFRSDGDYSDGRHPDAVRFADEFADCRRRDFTINGMYMDPASGEIIDHVGGRDDLAAGLIRTIGEPARRFQEDHLRLLRAIRFAARFDFSLEPATEAAVMRLAPHIRDISAERSRDELLKILTGPRPDKALLLMQQTGLLAALLPEVAALDGLEQPARFHPEGDVFTHTRIMLSLLPEHPAPELALAALLHDIGKPATAGYTDRIHFHGHDKAGAEIAEAVCRRFRLPNTVTERVVYLVANHMRFVDIRKMKLSTLKRFLAQPDFPLLLELHRLDRLSGNGALDDWEYAAQVRERLSEEELRPVPLVSGHDLLALGVAPGPELGKLLEVIREKQLNGEMEGREEALAYVKQALTGMEAEDAESPPEDT